MEIVNKKTWLSCIRVSIILLLFAMCVIINASFCGTYNIYELLEKTTVNETWAISESIITNGDGTVNFKSSFTKENNSDNETIVRNICIISMMDADISESTVLLLFLIIVFLFFYLTLFKLLPDEWTLINRKVRLDN